MKKRTNLLQQIIKRAQPKGVESFDYIQALAKKLARRENPSLKKPNKHQAKKTQYSRVKGGFYEFLLLFVCPQGTFTHQEGPFPCPARLFPICTGILLNPREPIWNTICFCQSGGDRQNAGQALHLPSDNTSRGEDQLQAQNRTPPLFCRSPLPLFCRSPLPSPMKRQELDIQC